MFCESAMHSISENNKKTQLNKESKFEKARAGLILVLIDDDDDDHWSLPW